MKKQFAATVYIFDDLRQRILLIFHHKLQKWLPPGGHMEPNETPSEAALREVYEETGHSIRFLQQENILVDRWNAKSIPRPYLCLLEEIPAFGSEPAHQHMDMIFVAELDPLKPLNSVHENIPSRWFSLEDLATLKPDEEIFQETVEVIRHLFLESPFKSALVNV